MRHDPNGVHLFIRKVQSCDDHCFNLESEGSRYVRIPSSGRKLHICITDVIPMESIQLPRISDPKPPIPKARPVISPDTVPILPGISICAYTTVTEKLENITRPMKASRTPVQNRLAYGSSSANGAAQIIEDNIIVLLPKRSESDPPKKVPTAPAARNIKI